MTGRECFAWGFAGGVAPQVVRFFDVVSRGQSLPNLNWPVYGFLLLIYAVMAGLVAIAFRPDSPWKGLWVGASLPALIATLVQTAPVPK